MGGSLLSAGLLILASVAGYVGFHHLVVGLRGRARAVHLSFSALSLLMGAYAAARLWRLNQGPELQPIVTAVKWAAGLEIAAAGVLFLFVSLYTGCYRLRTQLAVGGPLALLLAIHAARPHGYAFSAVSGVVHQQPPFGQPFWGLARQLGPLYYAFIAMTAVVLLSCFRFCILQYQRGERRRALNLTGALSFLLLAIVHNVLVDARVYMLPQMVEFSYLGLVVAMSLTLSDDVTRAAALGEALAQSERNLRTLLTERSQLEEQLRHSQKLEAVGQLAGGVAHDFNNLLTAMRGHAELLLQRVEHQPDTRDLASSIISAADRAAGVTRQLLSFARKTPVVRRQVDLHRIVDELIPMLGRVLDPRVQLQLDQRAPSAWTEGDPNLLQSALLNLALNARDAMPDGGTLTFRTRLLAVDAERAPALGLSAGEHVVLTVEDSGAGMTAQVLERAFEPFFTTKPPGKGTGLGLSAVYGIARGCGGNVHARSLLGVGTTIELYLPHRPPEESGAEVRPGPVRARGLRLLVVDDDPMVASSTARLLRSRGHQVQLADGGAKALELVGTQPFEAAVVDWIMPGLHGEALIAALREQLPALPIVVVSGYSAHEIGTGPGTAFVAKPFTGQALEDALAHLFDGEPPHRSATDATGADAVV